MTDKEIYEKIVKQGNCYGITCAGLKGSFNEGHDCPFRIGKFDFAPSSYREIVDAAKAWLRDHKGNKRMNISKLKKDINAVSFFDIDIDGNSKKDVYESIVRHKKLMEDALNTALMVIDEIVRENF